MNNHVLLRKSFTRDPGLRDGGELNPKQQDKFIVFVKRFSKLIREVSFVRMTQNLEDVDKMHVSEPITEAVAENTAGTAQARVTFNRVRLIAEKLKTSWDITTEMFRNNIEKEGFEDTAMEALTERISTDLELLAIQGDSSIGAPANATERLLQTFDGWDLLSENAHIVDVDGKSINQNIFSVVHRTLPSQYRNDPNIKWLISDIIANDWANVLAERLTNLGDAAIGGNPIAPIGKPMIVVPLIPSDKAVTISTGTKAEQRGTEFHLYEITTGTNDEFEVGISLAPITVTFPQGTFEAVTLAKLIRDELAANSHDGTAFDDGEGRLVIQANTAGSTADVRIGTGNANATLGFTDSTTVVGVDSGTDGVARDGSFLWLTNPLNLVFGMLNGTRVYSRFNQDFDRAEVRIFNEVAVQIENVDSLVKAVNIRRKDLS